MRRTLAALLLFSISVAAQGQGMGAERSRTTAWAFAGLGPGQWGDTALWAASAGFVVQRANALAMIRAVSIEHAENSKDIQDFGVLVGLASKPGVLHAGAAIGVGVSNSTQPDNGNVVAIPVEVMLGVRFLRYVGLSIRGFGSISSIGPIYGSVLALEMGRLR